MKKWFCDHKMNKNESNVTNFLLPYERYLECLKTIKQTSILLQQPLGGNSSVVKGAPLNWKVGCSLHSHCVNCRSAPWARAFTSNAPARRTIQASACRQLPSPKLTKKTNTLEK